MEDILADLFQDGLQVVDYERIDAKHNENSVRWFLKYTITWFKIVYSSVSGYHAFLIREAKTMLDMKIIYVFLSWKAKQKYYLSLRFEPTSFA